MAVSMLELQDLYSEALVREIIEKTKSCGLEWTHLGGDQFKATQDQDSVTWDLFVTKTQVTSSTYKYTLDVKKDSVAYITVTDGPLPHTERDSVAKDLYEIVEIIVLQMDVKLKETISFVQSLSDCHS